MKEVSNQIYNQIWEHINNPIYTQVWDQTNHRIWYFAAKQLGNRIRDNVRNRIEQNLKLNI